MPSIRQVALSLSVLSTIFSSTTAQTTAASAPGAIVTLGCYSTSSPLTLQGSWTYQSSGYCQTQCSNLNKPVMGTTQGTTCFCGDIIPALDKMVNQSNCNMKCAGYDQDTCGGLGFWEVYLTGLNTIVSTAPNSTSSSTSKASSPSASTPMETVIVTASATPTGSSANGTTNKIGIAVGVVVGLLAAASLVGAGFFFWRQKKRRELEEEYQRNLAAKNFLHVGKDKPLQDQRLDSSVFSHRRESIGSIADEMDFSRRILQVRNPDRDSKASSMA